MAKKKINSKMLPRKIVYALAAKWDTDYRTIISWAHKGDAMLTHPESLAIINAK